MLHRRLVSTSRPRWQVLVEDAAKSAQDRAAELRGELRLTQQEIQKDVAACHERLGQQKIEDIQDLPCEVKEMIQNRDLKRSRVAKELRAVLCKLQDTLKTATAGSGVLVQQVLEELGCLDEALKDYGIPLGTRRWLLDGSVRCPDSRDAMMMNLLTRCFFGRVQLSSKEPS
jgi:hypothetical protein